MRSSSAWAVAKGRCRGAPPHSGERLVIWVLVKVAEGRAGFAASSGIGGVVVT